MNMKASGKIFRMIALTAALILLYALPELHARHGTGIGIIAGEPTGISLKSWTDENHAIDAAVALSLSSDDSFQLHADYLIHDASSTVSAPELKGSSPWYYGIGGRFRTRDNDVHLGIRVPLGITYLFADAPLDFFAELAPVIDLTPDVDLDLNGAVGLRYYFR
jgi:hypothetical protein